MGKPIQTRLYFRRKGEGLLNIRDALRSRTVGLKLYPSPWDYNEDISEIVLPSNLANNLGRNPTAALSEKEQTPIYRLGMVRGVVKPLLSRNEGEEQAYKVDFYDPTTNEMVAYSTPYEGNAIEKRLKAEGKDVKKIRLVGFKLGDSLDTAINACFTTFDASVAEEGNVLAQYKDKELLVIVNQGTYNVSERFR